ncbi:hypothetical protein BS17DRAFT_829703 [Gyrodon lividus]|nr:hypothetical protein BS17DRAFT_829703 [Gyrodon lividus]
MFLHLMVCWALLDIFGLPATLAQESNATCQSTFAWHESKHLTGPVVLLLPIGSRQTTHSGRVQRSVGLDIFGNIRTYIARAIAYSVPAILPTQEYAAPSGTYANSCECNTVAYSLVSACAACQGANYITWLAWTPNCNETAGSLPQAPPSGTVIPLWAYISVSIDGTWNATAAYINASATSPPATISGGPLQTTTASVQVASPSSITTTTSSHPGTNVGAIVGGVVGGIMGLLAVTGIVLLCVRKRYRHTNRYSAGQLTDIPQPVPPYVFSGEPVGCQAPAETRKVYNPDDPSTFPVPLEPPAVLPTAHTVPPMPSIHPLGAYTGAPEV